MYAGGSGIFLCYYIASCPFEKSVHDYERGDISGDCGICGLRSH